MQRLTPAEILLAAAYLDDEEYKRLTYSVLNAAIDGGFINADDRVFEALRKTRGHERPQRFFTGRVDDDV